MAEAVMLLWDCTSLTTGQSPECYSLSHNMSHHRHNRRHFQGCSGVWKPHPEVNVLVRSHCSTSGRVPASWFTPPHVAFVPALLDVNQGTCTSTI